MEPQRALPNLASVQGRTAPAVSTTKAVPDEWGALWIHGQGVEQGLDTLDGGELEAREVVEDYPQDTVLVRRERCEHGFAGPWERVTS